MERFDSSLVLQVIDYDEAITGRVSIYEALFKRDKSNVYFGLTCIIIAS